MGSYPLPQASPRSDKTWQYARRVDPRIPREEVADFIRKQSIDQGVQRARRLGTFLPTGALDQIELDLADFRDPQERMGDWILHF